MLSEAKPNLKDIEQIFCITTPVVTIQTPKIFQDGHEVPPGPGPAGRGLQQGRQPGQGGR